MSGAVDVSRLRADDAQPGAERPALRARLLASARRDGQWGYPVACAGVLLVAFALRVWGSKQGLPYAYNADENAHFVPKAIALFDHGWNPHYFVNPPAYTYLLHLVFAVWFGGGEATMRSFAANPTEVFEIARITAAFVGTLSCWGLYLAGARLFDRRVGLAAAALMAVAFLPVFYSHLALNDVPTLAPISLSLWGTAGVLRLGRARDYALAGAGLGLACATKYTGGIMLLPLVGAIGAQLAAGRRPGESVRPALQGLTIAVVATLVAFFVANPYAFLSFGEFHDGLTHQTSVADAAAGKLGLTQDNGVLYYLWTATWGLGWVPAIAALGGVAVLWRDERRLVWALAPAPLLFILFMGSQARFFGRWLMPVLPLLCLLGAYAMLELADWAGRRKPELRPTLLALAGILLLGQGLVFSLHAGKVLSRPYTANSLRSWMVAHIPVRSKIVVEPVVPDSWASDVGAPSAATANGNRWVKYSTSRSNRANDGSILPGAGRVVNIEDYERTLFPGLVDKYEAQGFCWVVSGSTQRGRAEAEPEAVPDAIAYYRRLEASSDVVHVESPYAGSASSVPFNFDWSFDYYPLSYRRPGPLLTVYHLRGGACAR